MLRIAVLKLLLIVNYQRLGSCGVTSERDI